MPDWVTDLLRLLFGQLGVVGTVCAVAAVYSAWLLKLEQDAHNTTREKNEILNDKRIEVFTQIVETLSEMKTSVDTLTVTLNKRRRS